MSDSHNTKNYFAHGGSELVIGGKLTFLDGAEVENFPGGGSNGAKAAYVTDSEASTVASLKSDFNALLASLRAAGLMEAAVVETEPDTLTEGTEDGGG